MFRQCSSLARTEHWLSRRRPRVRVPSTPPTHVESGVYIVQLILSTSGRSPEVECSGPEANKNFEQKGTAAMADGTRREPSGRLNRRRLANGTCEIALVTGV